MKTHSFNQFVERLRHLSTRMSRKQVATIRDVVAAFEVHSLCLDLIERHGRQHPGCPHCHCEQVYRHGYAAGLQRYRCRGCRRTYNALTNTPLACLRLREKWLPYLECMLDSRTVRKSAGTVGIHRNTSFRWRHRFLAGARQRRPAQLQGIVEADETFILESQKGSRNLTRPARRRGGNARTRGITKQHDCILVARDRAGKTLDWVTGRGPVSAQQVERCLRPVLAADAVLVTDGAIAYRSFSSTAGIAHKPLNQRAGMRVDGPYHLQGVNGYHSRFKGWLARFRGVASRYLPNYLGWYRALDTRSIDTPAQFLLAALVTLPATSAC